MTVEDEVTCYNISVLAPHLEVQAFFPKAIVIQVFVWYLYKHFFRALWLSHLYMFMKTLKLTNFMIS